MRLAIWRTEHCIASTVAKYLQDGLGGDSQFSHGFDRNIIPLYDAHIGYGILRNMDNVYRECAKQNIPYFILDNGYFKPGHHDGYYRVSLNGTQETRRFRPDHHRLTALNLDIKPWRGCDPSKPVLVCPPTDAVKEFFNLNDWISHLPKLNGLFDFRVREKGDPTPINFDDYNYVITFNSSVGWQALQAGIPCISDPTHSIVGSFMHNISLDEQHKERINLFASMAACQFTLDEIRSGELCRYISAMIAENQLQAMSPPTLSSDEPALP